MDVRLSNWKQHLVKPAIFLFNRKMNRKSVIIGIACSVGLLLLCSLYYSFVLDDSFITYRYAKNLAAGKGIVWNINDNPVEGYTSFLWVVLNALSIWLNIDPVVFSRVVSAISALSVIWILARYSQNMHWVFAFIFTAAIGLAPSFAFLTMQGMETTLAALLLLLAALFSIQIITQPSKKLIFYWFIVAMLSALTRPDSVPFVGGIFVGLLGTFIIKKDLKTIKMLCCISIVFILIGSLYMTWRIGYFGYLFPNTYYVKVNYSSGIIEKGGMDYVVSFIKAILFPYLLLIAFLFGRCFDKDRVLRIIPIIIGCLGFGFYLLTIIPIQGFFWRYIYPIFPAFLLATLYCFSNYKPSHSGIKQHLTYVVLALIFAAWTLRQIPWTLHEQERRTQHDRVIAGKKLAGLSGTLFTSESGALSFYSGWKTVDHLGLNSEEVAHNSLSIKTLESLNPDLIMLHPYIKPGGYDPTRDYPLTSQYMIDNGFVAIAAIQKSLGYHHYYFARKNSELFDEIVNRLLNCNDLKYGNLSELMSEEKIPIYKGRN